MLWNNGLGALSTYLCKTTCMLSLDFDVQLFRLAPSNRSIITCTLLPPFYPKKKGGSRLQNITTVIVPCLCEVHEINFFHFKQLTNTLWHLEIYFKFFFMNLYENIFCSRNFMPLFSTSNVYHSWTVTFLLNTHLAKNHEGHNCDSASHAPCDQFCTSSSVQQRILLSDVQKDPTDSSQCEHGLVS